MSTPALKELNVDKQVGIIHVISLLELKRLPFIYGNNLDRPLIFVSTCSYANTPCHSDVSDCVGVCHTLSHNLFLDPDSDIRLSPPESLTSHPV